MDGSVIWFLSTDTQNKGGSIKIFIGSKIVKFCY